VSSRNASQASGAATAAATAPAISPGIRCEISVLVRTTGNAAMPIMIATMATTPMVP
jgi:hypothetical protein